MKFDVTFHPSWWNQNLGIRFTEDFFNNPEYRIASDVKMRRCLFEKFGEWGIGEENPEPRPLLGSDLIASGYLYSSLLGCDIRYSEEAPPEVICAALSEEEAGRFKAPSLEDCPDWQIVEEQIRWLQKEYGSVHSALNLQGVLNLALDLRGDSIFIDMYQDEEKARNLFDQCFDLSVQVGKRLSQVSTTLSGGVTAITNVLDFPGLYVHSNCSVEMISLDNYRDFLLEYDKKLSGLFQPYGIHHCGQSMEHVAEGYAEVPGMVFAEVGAGSKIAEVRKMLPDCWLNLRYSPVKLSDVPESELRTELQQMVLDGGGVASPVSLSCVGIDKSVSDEQVSLFLRIMKEIDQQG